jgi:hypothetical protein
LTTVFCSMNMSARGTAIRKFPTNSAGFAGVHPRASSEWDEEGAKRVCITHGAKLCADHSGVRRSLALVVAFQAPSRFRSI